MTNNTEKKVWTKEEIKALLETNNKMVEKSIVKIYELQTEDEKDWKETSHTNGIGYNGVDAQYMSSLAEWILSGRKLTSKQLQFGRKKIMKYAKQLTKVANEEI